MATYDNIPLSWNDASFSGVTNSGSVTLKNGGTLSYKSITDTGNMASVVGQGSFTLDRSSPDFAVHGTGSFVRSYSAFDFTSIDVIFHAGARVVMSGTVAFQGTVRTELIVGEAVFDGSDSATAEALFEGKPLEEQKALLASLIPDLQGAGEDHGAFVTFKHPGAQVIAAKLRERGVKTDARGDYLRICPDVLNSARELEQAAGKLKSLLA